jgi:hypothetical protein
MLFQALACAWVGLLGLGAELEVSTLSTVRKTG